MMREALILAEKLPGENQIHSFLFTLPSLFQRYVFNYMYLVCIYKLYFYHYQSLFIILYDLCYSKTFSGS